MKSLFLLFTVSLILVFPIAKAADQKSMPGLSICATYLMKLKKEHSIVSSSKLATAAILRDQLIPFRKMLVDSDVDPSLEALKVDSDHATKKDLEMVAKRIAGIEQSFENQGADETGGGRNFVVASQYTGNEQIQQYLDEISEINERLNTNKDEIDEHQKKIKELTIEKDKLDIHNLKGVDKFDELEQEINARTYAVRFLQSRGIDKNYHKLSAYSYGAKALLSAFVPLTFTFQPHLLDLNHFYLWVPFLALLAKNAHSVAKHVAIASEKDENLWLSAHGREGTNLIGGSRIPGYWSMESYNFEISAEIVKLLWAHGESKNELVHQQQVSSLIADQFHKESPLHAFLLTWFSTDLKIAINEKKILKQRVMVHLDVITAVNEDDVPSVVTVLRTSVGKGKIPRKPQKVERRLLEWDEKLVPQN